MRHPHPNEELLHLASQLLDGELDDAQYSRLCELVESDTRAATWLAEWMEQHALLNIDLGALDQRSLAARPLLSDVAGGEACGPAMRYDASCMVDRKPVAIRTGRSQAVFWYSLLSLGACFLMVLGYSWGWTAGNESSPLAEKADLSTVQPTSSAVPVATVAGGVDAHFDGGVTLGSRLVPGRLRLHRGIAQIAFDRGVTVLLQGPAELNIVDAATCQLIRGSLSADVLPEASGFSIAAGGVKIAERDARFGLKTSPESCTEVHAFGGGLNLIDYRHAIDQQRRLAEGEALRWQAEEMAEGIASDPSAFVTSDKFREAQRLQEQQSYERWLAYSQRWMADPNVLLRYEFSGMIGESIPNMANPKSDAAISLQPPRMLGGRWSIKPAMLFDGRTDRLTIADRPELRLDGDLTLAVWLRTRSYPVQGWTRVIGKGQGCDRNFGLWMEHNGEMLWQVCPDEDPEDQAQWDRYSLRTKAVPVGRWILVVGVVENGQLKVYINDELQKSADAPARFALNDDPLTIGYYGDVPQHDQYFCGDLDELILLKRALSEEEIKEMYEAGNPAAISDGTDSPAEWSTEHTLPNWDT